VILHANGVRMCLQCHEWHGRALLMIGGSPPPGCQECGLTFAEYAAICGGKDVRFVAVPKDGIYQVLCGACTDAYVPKRLDLVEGTEFGSRL
jgi:hypothetical protein